MAGHTLKLATAVLFATGAAAQSGPSPSPVAAAARPEDADARAAATERRMTDAERIAMVHGIMAIPDFPGTVMPPDAVPGAGYVAGVPRLGVPALRESDASLGVAWVGGLRGGKGATALPAALALAASFDPALAYRTGALIGRETAQSGYNVLLAGGVNLTRDPRGGRGFEYLGEDPLLAGTMAGESVRGIQDQHVLSTIKHFAFNDQENGRDVANVLIGEAAARESDLLAFQIAIERGRPGAVMCGYNRFRGDQVCGSRHLLTDVLKRDWQYPGWVMSDWGAVYATDYALAGLDQQSGEQLDRKIWFGAPLAAAVADDARFRTRLPDMARRILRSIYAVGLDRNPAVKAPIDVAAGAAVAQEAAERGIVLLRNEGGLLPLAAGAKRIAVIGWQADAGVLSGGGSSQVAPDGGPARLVPMGGDYGAASLRNMAYHGSSPLKAIQARAKDASVRFADGTSPYAAARLAAQSDVAIVFATQWMMEGYDNPDLSLPFGQDETIRAVAAANPRTIVVLETGGPVTMPWLSSVGAVMEAWYPGIRGAEAITRVLFGDVNPSGRLPVTFPQSVSQLPRPEIPGWDLINAAPWDWANHPKGRPFDVDYRIEGSDIGYRWFARTGAAPLFPFGFGLSYTRFTRSGLSVSAGSAITARMSIRNEGTVVGRDASQLYLMDAAGTPHQRLVGWASLDVKPGETASTTVSIDPRLLADWDDRRGRWHLRGGRYRFRFAADAVAAGLETEVDLTERFIRP